MEGNTLNVRELVGSRCLMKVSLNKRSFIYTPIDEFKVLEVSESGNFVKLQNIYGNKFWSSITEIAFVEKLKSLEARPN